VATPELSGVAVVGAGTFNPAILHPSWLAEKGLIPIDIAKHAMEQNAAQPIIVSPQLTVFVADWLTVQVTQGQAVFSTVDQGRELDVRDVARGVFELLPETPIDALGINSDTHFQAQSEGAWHAFGDQFLPKDFWEPIFEDGDYKQRADGKRVGMRSMTVEVSRTETPLQGWIRVEIAPSLRIGPYGIFIGINGHFVLPRHNDIRGNGGDAARVLMEQWEGARETESRLVAKLLEAV